MGRDDPPVKGDGATGAGVNARGSGRGARAGWAGTGWGVGAGVYLGAGTAGRAAGTFGEGLTGGAGVTRAGADTLAPGYRGGAPRMPSGDAPPPGLCGSAFPGKGWEAGREGAAGVKEGAAAGPPAAGWGASREAGAVRAGTPTLSPG